MIMGNLTKMFGDVAMKVRVSSSEYGMGQIPSSDHLFGKICPHNEDPNGPIRATPVKGAFRTTHYPG